VTALLAELVGPEGHVVGLDASAAQLALARERLTARSTNLRFVEASATDSGLPPASFDVVYVASECGRDRPRGDAAHGAGVGAEARSPYRGFNMMDRRPLGRGW
jgi:hypothetical protein